MKITNEHDESLFYCDVEENQTTQQFITPLKEYSIQHSKQIYILRKALGTSKEYTYDLTDVAIILMPKHPILILNYGSADCDALEDYQLDFREDLGFLADKYNYLRFDHDEVRADKMYHPENHIDFNYTGGATFKFGLTKPITHLQLIDMINISTPCSYLSAYKK